MTESSFTLEQLTSLEAAIADGALKVKYSDKEVEYRSLDEMLRIRDMMKNDLGVTPKSCAKKGLFGGKRLTMKHSKGL